MSTVKRINGDYTIINKGIGLDAAANVTVTTNTLFVDGNLVVGGNSTSVHHTELTVTDNFVTINQGETGSGVTLVTAGIYVDRGLLSNVAVRWNESVARWQITNDGSMYGNILTTVGGGVLTAVVDDPAPQLGGNLNITGKTLYSTSPSVTMFAYTPGAGGTGLAVNVASTTNQELITKTKALIYSVLL